MKKVFSIVMVLALTLAITSAALAQVPGPGGPYNSEFSVQNLESTQASCSYTFYKPDGTVGLTSAAVGVAPNSSLTVYVPNVTGLLSGSYSAVVSCDKQVAAITNFDDKISGAAHEGITEPATTWYAPVVYDNYFTFFSNIVVQNASSGPVDITVDIYAPGNPTPVLTQSETAVPANASVSFEQDNQTVLNNNIAYSAVISGTGNIAPIVNIYGSGNSALQLYSYNPFKAGSTTAYAPALYNKRYTYDTELTIQNIGDNTANVEVTYSTGLTKTLTIASHASTPLYTPNSGLPVSTTVYSAIVESTNGEPVVLLVNISNANQRAASYTGFAAGSMTAVAPFVAKNYYTFDSSMTCQNLGSAQTDLKITYAATTTPPFAGGSTTYQDLQPGKTIEIYQPNDPALANVGINFKTGATVESLDGQPIVCIVNSDFIPAKAGQILDQLKSYEGIAP